ncbi:MAG: superoxide dismutase [Ni] [candidate division KSB1 bacterium]|nr:superoxide dismutase [Ni] [candidate division KSB1 bacterium]
MKRLMYIMLIVLIMSPVKSSYAHCEIPCGIYNDKMRCDLIEEHITTIEKSMNMIIKLSDQETINYNQLVRWINNKEAHANEIQHIVTQYFMTQRVKPVEVKESEAQGKYVQQLSLLHELLVYSMKAKQTTDLKHISTLKQLIHDFRAAYFGPEEHGHTH